MLCLCHPAALLSPAQWHTKDLLLSFRLRPVPQVLSKPDDSTGSRYEDSAAHPQLQGSLHAAALTVLLSLFDDAQHNNHEWHPSLCSSLYFFQRKPFSDDLDPVPTDHSAPLFAFHSQCKSHVYG